MTREINVVLGWTVPCSAGLARLCWAGLACAWQGWVWRNAARPGGRGRSGRAGRLCMFLYESYTDVRSTFVTQAKIARAMYGTAAKSSGSSYYTELHSLFVRNA